VRVQTRLAILHQTRRQCACKHALQYFIRQAVHVQACREPAGSLHGLLHPQSLISARFLHNCLFHHAQLLSCRQCMCFSIPLISARLPHHRLVHHAQLLSCRQCMCFLIPLISARLLHQRLVQQAQLLQGTQPFKSSKQQCGQRKAASTLLLTSIRTLDAHFLLLHTNGMQRNMFEKHSKC